MKALSILVIAVALSLWSPAAFAAGCQDCCTDCKSCCGEDCGSCCK